MGINRLFLEIEQTLLLWVSVCMGIKRKRVLGDARLTLQSGVRALRRRPSSGAIRRCRRTFENSRCGSFLPRGHNWDSGRAVRAWRVEDLVLEEVSDAVRGGETKVVMVTATARGRV